MNQPDLVLLHAPSVFDFRQRSILYGPISDLIPSSTIFEMYPLGFLTMTSYLARHGLSVRIVNLALRMMNDSRFDVPAFLARLKPRAFGIDLHWLPHAHGALEVARLLKEIHPQIPVIFGGLSASYFHEELIRYPQADYVLRGDSVEPPLHQLLLALARGDSPQTVPNLTWKENGTVHVNPATFLPASLDYVDLAPEQMVRMAVRYRDLQSVLPFNGWWRNPITALFTVKGCAHECVTCGSSQSGCRLVSLRPGPVFRSPPNLVANMQAIAHFCRGPIFLVGDLRQAGDEYAHEVLDRLGHADLGNEIVFECFEVPPPAYLDAIARSVRNWSLELSPESHDERIRAVQDETTTYTNAEMEEAIEQALALGCHRTDVFFMIGLPQQTPASVLATVDYCGELFRRYDSRLSCFISPLGPFLDPGSRGFEQPERFGYRLFARTLEEHRRLLVQPTWQQMLNYETRWMNRETLADVTYTAGAALNRLKLAHGRVDPGQGKATARRIEQAQRLNDRLRSLGAGETLETDQFRSLQGDISAFSISTVCDKRELYWPVRWLNFRPGGILSMLISSPGQWLLFPDRSKASRASDLGHSQRPGARTVG
jgi:B12-binding domain/radical SAM domain protein